jgi:hypothetical protein
MRDAKVTDLKSDTIPVLLAHLPVHELNRWFPVQMRRIPNPYEEPEPCRAALFQLDGAPCCLLSYLEFSRELMLRIPENASAKQFLGALFREVPQLRERVVWMRKQVRSRNAARRRS